MSSVLADDLHDAPSTASSLVAAVIDPWMTQCFLAFGAVAALTGFDINGLTKDRCSL
jgi:hypothetical protein